MHTLKALCLRALLVLMLATTSLAAAPVRQTSEIQFDDTDPCSGTIHTVTIDFEDLIHEMNGRTVDTSHTTVSTSPKGIRTTGTKFLLSTIA